MLRQGFAMPASSLSRVQDVRLNKTRLQALAGFQGTANAAIHTHKHQVRARFQALQDGQAQQMRLQAGVSSFQGSQAMK